MRKQLIMMLALMMVGIGGLTAQQNAQKRSVTVAEQAKPDSKDSHRDSYSPETRAIMRADRLAQQVELTDAQKKKVVELFTKEETKRAEERTAMKKEQEQQRAIREEERQKKMEARKAEQEKCDAELEKIIGTEKMQIVKEQRQQQEQQRPPMNDNHSNKLQK